MVPGPSAAIAALVLSGLPTDRFAFEGFLPRRPGDRARRLQALRHDPRTIVFFESPRRVLTLLREIGGTLGDRRIALCRELTKLHEEVLRGTVAEVLTAIGERGLKGEVAVVVEGDHDGAPMDQAALLEEVRRLIAEGMRTRDAARAVAERHGASANDLYRAAVSPDYLPERTDVPTLTAMAQAPPPLGPDLVPPRPDRPAVEDEAASPRLFVAFVVATLVAILLGGLAVASLLRGPSDTRDDAAGTLSPTPPTVSVAPSPSPSPRPTGRRRLQVPRARRRRTGPMEPVR